MYRRAEHRHGIDGDGGGGGSHRESAAGNKDEGIGVGGWTIRRDHPMKPSAVQGIVDIPYHREVLLEMARGKSETR